MSESTATTPRSRRIGRIAIVAVAGASLGLGGAMAASAALNNEPAPACRVAESDLRQAAEAARRLEALNPALFEQSPRPADYNDLRLAAEWAGRLAILAPDSVGAVCSS